MYRSPFRLPALKLVVREKELPSVVKWRNELRRENAGWFLEKRSGEVFIYTMVISTEP